MKRFAAVMLAALMAAGTCTNVFAAGFADINNVPWEGAKQYINRVADLGLMVGEKDSKGNDYFRAKDGITYCETMQLAYSLLNKTNSLKTTVDTTAKWKPVLDAANIPQWAHKATAYGLESGIISPNDIDKIFMESPTKSRAAIRENVAVIIGKALAQIFEVNNSAVLTFKDSSSVSKTSVPYIELLARLNILVGDEAGNFNPKKYINRAEMAVIISKSYDAIEEYKKNKPVVPEQSVKTFTGKVILTDNGADKKTIAVSDSKTGVSSNFVISAMTPVIMADGTVKSYEDVTLGDTVTITTSGGIAVSIILQNDMTEQEKEPEKKEDLEGILNNVTPFAITFDTEDGRQMRYDLVKNPDITLNGNPLAKDVVQDYIDGRNIMFVKVELDDRGMAEAFDITFRDIEGGFKNAKDDFIYVDYKYGKFEKTVKLEIANNCEIYIDGEKSSKSKLEKLAKDEDEDGLYAIVDVSEFNKAKKIEIFHETYDKGELESISSSSMEVKSLFGKTMEYDINDDCNFKLNGHEASYRDIRNALKDDEIIVNLEFNKDDEVVFMNAQTIHVKGILKTLEPDRLSILDEDGNRNIIPVNWDVKCEFNDKEITIKALAKEFEETEQKWVAEVKLDKNGEIEKIKAWEGSDTEGYFVSHIGKDFVFEDVAGVEHSYEVEPGVKGYYDGTEIFPGWKIFERIKEGTYVKVGISSRGTINRIYVIKD